MAVSDQELRRQIAEMREGLRAIHAAERRGKWARVLGLLGGIGLVLFFVLRFINLGQSVFTSGQISEVASARVKSLNLQSWPGRIIEEAGPACAKEAGKVLDDTNFGDTAKQELQVLISDLQPVVVDQFARIRPRLAKAIEEESALATEELRNRITETLRTRMGATLKKHKAEIEQRLKLTPDQGNEVMLNLINANNTAMRQIVEKRWGQNTENLHLISEYVSRLPDPPRMSDEDMMSEATRVLIALAKYKLPDYILDVEDRKHTIPDYNYEEDNAR